MTYEQDRAARITTMLSTIQVADPVIFVGNSHVEGFEKAFLQGEMRMAGKYVYFAGIAGAHYGTLHAYIPWAAIAAVHPSRIVIVEAINGATVPSHFDSNGNATLAFGHSILSTVATAKSIAPVTLVVDPPPEQAQGIDPYRAHQAARWVYYAATENWANLGWTGSWPGTSGFVDLRSTMAASPCSPPSVPYQYPCYAVPGSTMDTVHWAKAGLQNMFERIVA